MALLRTYAVVFLAGWALWFWLDKAGPESASQPTVPLYGGGPAGGYPPYPPPPVQGTHPAAEGDLIEEFQYAVDLLKSGGYRQSFIYLWRRESWIAAAVLTVLVLLAGPAVLSVVPSRRIFTRLYHRGRPPR